MYAAGYLLHPPMRAAQHNVMKTNLCFSPPSAFFQLLLSLRKAPHLPAYPTQNVELPLILNFLYPLLHPQPSADSEDSTSNRVLICPHGSMALRLPQPHPSPAHNPSSTSLPVSFSLPPCLLSTQRPAAATDLLKMKI